MANPGKAFSLVLSDAAGRDIINVLKWSETQFGAQAAARYRALLTQALCDLEADPERAGSRERPELAEGVRTYHLLFSRGRSGATAGLVRNPRHFVIYRRVGNVIEVARVLHDARDLHRHLPEDYRRGRSTDPDDV